MTAPALITIHCAAIAVLVVLAACVAAGPLHGRRW